MICCDVLPWIISPVLHPDDGLARRCETPMKAAAPRRRRRRQRPAARAASARAGRPSRRPGRKYCTTRTRARRLLSIDNGPRPLAAAPSAALSPRASARRARAGFRALCFRNAHAYDAGTPMMAASIKPQGVAAQVLFPIALALASACLLASSSRRRLPAGWQQPPAPASGCSARRGWLDVGPPVRRRARSRFALWHAAVACPMHACAPSAPNRTPLPAHPTCAPSKPGPQPPLYAG